MKRKKSVSIVDFFYFYPYKKNFSKNNTICQPYIKFKDEVPDHKYTMIYPEWKSVVDTFIEHAVEELLKGKEFYLNHELGFLQLRKYKSTKQIDYSTWRKTGEKTYYDNYDDYTVLLKWYRKYFEYSFHWKVRMATNLSKKLHKMLTTKPDTIYNILDT